MLQSEIVNKMIELYRQAGECYSQKGKVSFYKCLRCKLKPNVKNDKNKKEILKQYEMSAKAYTESNLLQVNFSIGAFMISVVALMGEIIGKVLSENTWLGISLAAYMVIALTMSIHLNRKERKLREILYVLKDMLEE